MWLKVLLCPVDSTAGLRGHKKARTCTRSSAQVRGFSLTGAEPCGFVQPASAIVAFCFAKRAHPYMEI